MKLLTFITLLSLILSLSGCGEDPIPPKPEIVYKIIYKTKIVNVPVTCDVKEPYCEFTGEGYTPAIKMTECVVKQKKYINTCRGKRTSVTK